MIDNKIFNKISVLRNGISLLPIASKSLSKKALDLVYVGSLVEQKGFKKELARVWADINKIFPDTRLHVIGSGNLYDRNNKLGDLGIADKNFEEKIIKKYLCDFNGNLSPNVIFHGALGTEKYEVIEKCSIGIANQLVN